MPDPDIQPTDWDSTNKALEEFHNLRTNLALATSFARESFLRPETWDGHDLGFIGVKPERSQLEVHNGAVSLILVALTYQALQNYCQLTRLLPRLKDVEVEQCLDGLEDRQRFTAGMKKLRQAVFHVKRHRWWRHQDIQLFERVCAGRGGTPAVMQELLNNLYAFTAKVFSGKLMIWPPGTMKAMEEDSSRQAAEDKISLADFGDDRDALDEYLVAGNRKFPTYGNRKPHTLVVGGRRPALHAVDVVNSEEAGLGCISGRHGCC